MASYGRGDESGLVKKIDFSKILKAS